MEAILKEINAVVGVVGSFVCAADGGLVAQAMPADYDAACLDAAAHVVYQTFNALDVSGLRVAEADLLFGRGRLILKNLRGGVLVILCARAINVPLLNLTANLAAKKIAAEIKPPKPAAAPAPTMPAPPPVAPVAVEVAPPPPQAQVVEVAPSALLAELEQEMKRIIAAAQKARVTLRALDPLAFWLRCPQSRALLAAPQKRQMDFVGRAAQSEAVMRVFGELGYQPHARFNAFYNHRRLRFEAARDLSAEVYLDTFDMYHHLDLTPFLAHEDIALPETALALLRLQLVEMPEAGLRDLGALLLEHDLSIGSEPARIDAAHITRLCADDWGWYKTVSQNLERVAAFAATALPPSESAIVVERAQRLLRSIADAPKSLRWQMRARLGDGVRWYEAPRTPDLSAQPKVTYRFGD